MLNQTKEPKEDLNLIKSFPFLRKRWIQHYARTNTFLSHLEGNHGFGSESKQVLKPTDSQVPATLHVTHPLGLPLKDPLGRISNYTLCSFS